MERLEDVITKTYGNDVRVIKRTPVSGGDINRAYLLDLSDGTKVFMKSNRKSNADFFRAEAEGLTAIRQTGTARVPEVIARGEDGNEAFLLLEYIASGARCRRSSEELGTDLGRMHLADTGSLVRGGLYGFTDDNYIGAGSVTSPRRSVGR